MLRCVRPINPAGQRRDKPTSSCSGSHSSDRAETDEALALRLQQELDREAAEAQAVDLEDGGLFFCQICHRDLSHMTAEGRTQHLNRCLDQNEQSAPSAPPPSAVPDCPICGKKFKTQKSRSAHLKRCSADMGVSPAVLLQALQRQAEESRISSAANTQAQPAGSKRKGPSKAELPARKKPRKKNEPVDEETMVALALSSSLLEQQTKLQAESGPPHSSMTPVLKWKPDAAKKRVKNKKAAAPRPPPLLLIQDAETALLRLQERVSALLLRHRAPSPPTPTRRPSSLPAWTGAAPLWQKSSLLDGDSNFYTAELQHLFTAESATANEVSSSTNSKPESCVPPVLPSCSQAASSAPSTPGTGGLSVGSQALQDLMDLAEDGMTLTQYGYSDKAKHLSGFIQEEEVEDQAEPTGDAHSSQTVRRSHHPDADRDSHEAVALTRLSSDLRSMVNNPQLSDVQLQVDSGDVYFAHSFMVYARCPLLAEMVYESGFGVQEEGMPAAQRVLLNDMPGQAVLALLQYLYTAHCSITARLRPHVLELASRFDLQELEHLCHLQPESMAEVGDDELNVNQEENVNNQTDQAFVELLRSMWNEEDEDEGTGDSDGVDGGGPGEEDRRDDEVTAGDREISEEHVNEDELEEIYEFAATQRQREEQERTEEEKEEDEGEDAEPGGDAVVTNLQPEPDCSYSRLFSQSWGVYNGGDKSCRSDTPLQSKQNAASQEAVSKRSGRTLLQSSASVVDEPSLNLPMPGLSPGQAAHQTDDGERRDEAAETKGVSQQRDSQGPPLSPDPSPKRDEPELIVLSDSGEEMEVKSGNSPQNYTGIKSSPSPKGSSRSFQFSPGDPAACSPELSWLIPSTPPQSIQKTRTCSVQTNSSMCRTQLFPRGDSSPATSPFKNKFQTCSSPLRGSAGDAASRESRSKQSENLLSSSDLNVSIRNYKNSSKNTEVFEAPHSFRESMKRETPLHLRFQPCSSTPLHTDPLQPPVPPAASPLHIDPERQSVSEQMKVRTSLDSLGAAESGSFHLPRMSSPSDPPSSSSHEKTAESNMQHGVNRIGGRNEQENIERTGFSQETKEEMSAADVREASFNQSFGDEPPIAFNDSWGLDACMEANPGCFSLKLEETGDSSPRERPGSSSASKQPSINSIQDPAPDPGSPISAEIDNGLLDSRIWESWEGDEEEEDLPLSQRVNPSAHLKTPVSSKHKRRPSVVPITPMPHYSDMDTPELKNKLNRFGVRPLPKRQMVLKLKEIHQYTHQLVSSDSEEEAAPRVKHPMSREVSCAQKGQFKEPRAPDTASPIKAVRGEEVELLSTSQGSNSSSSTAASQESERSNPELVLSSDGDSDSDGGISSSQAASRLQDRLQAVRSFILSDSSLYSRILQYQPLVLSQLQQQLKEAGIRLGAAKLMDYLDSQCITFTTAKRGHPTAGHRRAKKSSRGARGGSRKNGALKL
ncbi:PREDICTED: structure-specific endonuclease subunit SLX4 [Cyprinodon variegatus]|nr:PREDICTED: structure-specific endonuclease subunit SLX4 [Cyprinodon variegatus]